MQKSERRRSKRVKRSCAVRVRFYQNPMEGGRSSNWELVTMKDLSAVGMLFSHIRKIPVGSMLDFSILLPYSDEPIRCIGRVIRVEDMRISEIRPSQIPVYLIAVSFQGLDEKGQGEIKKICEK